MHHPKFCSAALVLMGVFSGVATAGVIPSCVMLGSAGSPGAAPPLVAPSTMTPLAQSSSSSSSSTSTSTSTSTTLTTSTTSSPAQPTSSVTTSTPSTSVVPASPAQGSAPASADAAAKDPTAITAALLLKFAPSSGDCSGAQYPSQCVTAAVAAPLIQAAFEKYNIKAAGEKAALLALMSVESNNFQYRSEANSDDANAGQGTANMQSPDFNLQYAQSFPELAGKVKQITSGSSGLSADQKRKVLALVTTNDYNFGSGPWFYSTQCSDQVKAELQSGSDNGYNDYITQCVGAPMAAGRQTAWRNAKSVMGL